MSHQTTSVTPCTTRMPAHIMVHIAQYDGTVQSIVSVSQCQRAMHRFLRNYRLDLSKQMLTKEQIISCAAYFNITGLDLSSFSKQESIDHMSSIFQCLPSLEKLIVSNLDTACCSSVPHLRHLNIGSVFCTDSSSNDTLSFLQHLPMLEYLSIKSFPSDLRGDIGHFIHTPSIQHIDLNITTASVVHGDIAVFQQCPDLRWVNLREGASVVGDIVALQQCPNLVCFSMLRTGVHGNTEIVRTSLRKLEKFDCQSTQITGKTSDFRFCNNLIYLRYWGSNITNFGSMPGHDNGTQYSDQYKGLKALQWLANWSKQSDEVKAYER